jgi:hypothetical protein
MAPSLLGVCKDPVEGSLAVLSCYKFDLQADFLGSVFELRCDLWCYSVLEQGSWALGPVLPLGRPCDPSQSWSCLGLSSPISNSAFLERPGSLTGTGDRTQ